MAVPKRSRAAAERACWSLVGDHGGDTFRAAYTVKFATAVYVLHAFQKKSKSGIKTPTEEMELIQRRLKAAEADYKAQLEKGKAP